MCFIWENFNFKLSTYWAQSDVFGVKSKGFNKIRQIRLFRQRISENLEYNIMSYIIWQASGYGCLLLLVITFMLQ